MWARNSGAVLVGLIGGVTAGISVSAVWTALLVPARLQQVTDVQSPRLCGWAVWAGMTLAALENALGLSLPLSRWSGAAALLFAGAFVGMLACALGEILDVVPHLLHRLGIPDKSRLTPYAMLLGKSLGAVLAALLVGIGGWINRGS